MRLYLIQREESSGIPEKPEVFVSMSAAKAAWDAHIEEDIADSARRNEESVEDARDALIDRNFAVVTDDLEHPEAVLEWGAAFVEVNEDVLMRAWDVEVEIVAV
jgi:hypothetical protein